MTRSARISPVSLHYNRQGTMEQHNPYTHTAPVLYREYTAPVQSYIQPQAPGGWGRGTLQGFVLSQHFNIHLMNREESTQGRGQGTDKLRWALYKYIYVFWFEFNLNSVTIALAFRSYIENMLTAKLCLQATYVRIWKLSNILLSYVPLWDPGFIKFQQE